MSVHSVAPTTHTVELDQLAQINAALDARPGRVTAADLGLGTAPLTGRGATGPAAGAGGERPVLPGFAVLRRVEAYGPPEYPYVRGHFGAEPWRPGDLGVDLHTDALTALSHRLDLHHRWGAR